MKLIWSFLLVPTIFATVAGVVFQAVMTYGMGAWTQYKNVGVMVGMVALFIVGLVVFALAWWVLGLRLLALIRLALNFSPTLEHAKEYMWRRKWGVMGVYFSCLAIFTSAIVAWAVVIGFGVMLGGTRSAASALAAIVGFFGMMISLALYLIVGHLALVLIACEDESVPVIVGKALSIMFNHFWRACAFGIIFGLTFSIISYPLALPVAAITFFDAMQHGLTSGGAGKYEPPLYILVLAQSWESLIGMYLRPLVALAFGLFYYDLRLRSEGLDLKRKLENMLPKIA